jgi:hypothetical protein
MASRQRQRRQAGQGIYGQDNPAPTGDTSSIESYKVVCKGGLVKNESVINHTDGEAIELQNYEPNILGGYARVLGFNKYDSNFVPGTAAANSGNIIGLYVFKSGSEIIACRGDRVNKSSGSGWTDLNAASRSTGAVKYRFTRFNWTGTEQIVMTDETNNAASYDGTTFTRLNGAGAPSNPKYCAAHRGRLFLGGYTSNAGAITYSAVNDETDWSAAGGAGEIVIGDTIVNLISFRERLIIFCANSIWQLQGISTTGTDAFFLSPITRNLGCVHSDSVQEFGGDVIFLAHDGIRTIAGTERIDDIEIGVISRNITTVLNRVQTFTNVASLTLKEKSQYRLLFSNVSTTHAQSEGVIGGIRRQDQPGIVQGNSQSGIWEWGQLKGFKAIVAASGDIGSNEYNVFANENSYVYRMETANSLDGSDIESIYRTPDLDMGDVAIRKTLHRVRIYHTFGGTTSVAMSVLYDFWDTTVAQPAEYTITDGGSSSVYGTAVYGTAVYGAQLAPTQRKNTEGSGFTIGLRFYAMDTNAPHTIQGFVFEVVAGGRN